MPKKRSVSKPPSSARVIAQTAQGGEIEAYELSQLQFDLENPRFGSQKAGSTEKAVLEFIFNNFDLTDVLSSIAVNGFFRSEPLIGVRQRNNKIKIVEGNRRLAACSILLNDPRAESLKTKTERYRDLWVTHGSKVIAPLPVAVYETSDESKFLAYLGVRHIQGSRTWDSYAKAAWIHSMTVRGMSIDDIASMIGDTSRLAKKLLSAYYLSEQLEAEGLFNPKQSMRKGKGSCVSYPFSWVYTILNNPSLREWLDLSDEPTSNPLPNKTLKRAETLYLAMFGQEGKRDPAIEESRYLGQLASVIVREGGERLLRTGSKLEEVIESTKDAKTKVEDGLTRAEQGLRSCLVPLQAKELDADAADSVLALSTRVQTLARSVNQNIKDVISAE